MTNMVEVTKIILAIIVIFSVALNGGTCYLLIRIKKKNAYVVFCIHLAISDLLQALCGYIPSVVNGVSSNGPTSLCIGSALVVGQMAITSISIITVLSMFRIYDLVKKTSCDHPQLLKVNFFALLAWGYASFWAFLPIFGWSRYVLEPTGRGCSLDWTLKTLNAKSYIYSVTTFCFILPVIIHAISLLIARKAIKRLTRYSSTIYGRHNAITVKAKRGERKSLALCFIMFGAFIMAWTPYTLVGLLSQHIALPMWSMDASALLAKSSTAINPLIYCCKAKFRCKSFLKEFQRTSSGLKNLHCRNEQENTTLSTDVNCNV